MSQALPCLGADINGMPEIIEAGKTGYIVPRQSPDAIAEAVRSYYADESNRYRMGAAALERVREHFTWDVVMRRVNSIMGIAPAPGN
jgi:glycosyltransferase involved in cell wall biosynthesis